MESRSKSVISDLLESYKIQFLKNKLRIVNSSFPKKIQKKKMNFNKEWMSLTKSKKKSLVKNIYLITIKKIYLIVTKK